MFAKHKICNKGRASNIELLRSIAMFMVLALHANFVALGKPTYEDLLNNTNSTITRIFFEALCISSVNIFVFISGWFGLRPTTKGVFRFIFQILFFWGGGFLVTTILGITTFSFIPIAGVLQLTSGDWFIKSYFVLLIMAPILNSFINNSSISIQKNVIFYWFAFELVYGWIAGGRRFFVDGYGPLHFIGLYLLARYINTVIHSGQGGFFYRMLSMPKCFFLMIYVLSAIALTTFIWKGLSMFGNRIYGIALAYCSPFAIVGCLSLFLVFLKLKLNISPFINWLGASSFAVYLLHSEHTIRKALFVPLCNGIYSSRSGIMCVLYFFILLIIIFFISCVFDYIRVLIWSFVEQYYTTRKRESI